MPIYEYVCRECGHELEKLQKLSADPLTDCPECGQAALKRKVSAAGFRLAGSGWYETDFKSSGQRNLAGHDSQGGQGDNGKSADKSSTGKSATDKPASNKSASNKPDTARKAGTAGADSP